MADGDLSVRMKYHVYGVLANIGAALPCISDWSSGLPRVTGQCLLLQHKRPRGRISHDSITGRRTKPLITAVVRVFCPTQCLTTTPS